MLPGLQRPLPAGPFEGPVNGLATGAIQPRQPVLVRRRQRQQIPAGVIALAHVPPVVHRPTQYHVTELGILHRPEAGGAHPLPERAQLQHRQPQPSPAR